MNGDLADDDDEDGDRDDAANGETGPEGFAAVNNRSRSRGRSAGATAQIARTTTLHRLVAGAGFGLEIRF